MADESKPIDPTHEHKAQVAAQTPATMTASKQAIVESEVDSEDDAGETEREPVDRGATDAAPPAAAGTAQKKKKKRGKKIRQMLSGKHDSGGAENQGESGDMDKTNALAGLTNEHLEEFMKLNPALGNELLAESKEHAASSSSASANTSDAMEALKRLKLEDVMTGLASSGKNRKDMGAYKFWKTQPVPQFGDDQKNHIEEGPLKIQEVKDIPTEPEPLLLEKFRWVTVDLTNEHEMEEVYKLLNGHYVEDDEAMFRFKYSTSLLKWALMSPGWKKQWFIGIRSGNTLCAFISAIPADIRVRDKVLHASEVNFLCVHKKLRNKRLAPVLIKEITRVINLEGIWQAIYTGGVVLPRPVSTCRYFHRAINWQKLYEVGFSPCPANSKPAFQVRKYALPENTSTRGLRDMEAKDVDSVRALLGRYLKRFDLAPEFTEEDVRHWLLPKRDVPEEQVVWSYVVEGNDKKITDFFSFYCLESSVINNTKHSVVRAAYAFYYATETGLTVPSDNKALKSRLTALFMDALILAKRHGFDVFNGLSLMDNALFLEDLKFGPGDGQLHYYLFNYKARPIRGGVDKKNQLDENNLSGVGFIML